MLRIRGTTSWRPLGLAWLLSAVALLPAGAQGAPLPQRLGECRRSSVKEVLYRLSSTDANGVLIPIPGSGSAITFTNGGYQVSYDTVPAIHRSREGDVVQLCLSFIPDCRQAAKDDRRGRRYTTRNLRTGEFWTLPDSQHACGGA